MIFNSVLVSAVLWRQLRAVRATLRTDAALQEPQVLFQVPHGPLLPVQRDCQNKVFLRENVQGRALWQGTQRQVAEVLGALQVRCPL
jgi:hypothetical protein